MTHPASMAIYIASDHGGFALKTALKAMLEEGGYTVTDLGPDTPDRVDYPDFAKKLTDAMADADNSARGILVCGSGIGISIAANRATHIRAAVITDVTTARLSREHNDANVICLGERLIGEQTAIDCVNTFLTTEFEGGRHAGRVAKLGNC